MVCWKKFIAENITSLFDLFTHAPQWSSEALPLLREKAYCCFLPIRNGPVSLELLHSPQQSRCCSHAPTWCLLVITFPGFPMLFPKGWGIFSPLLFLSYHTRFPHTYSKFTTITIRHTTTVCVTTTISERSFLELLWKHRHCWKSFLGNSWHLTCSLGPHHLKLISQFPVSYLIKGRR